MKTVMLIWLNYLIYLVKTIDVILKVCLRTVYLAKTIFFCQKYYK